MPRRKIILCVMRKVDGLWIYGSQRGKSLGILAPWGLGKAEAEGKPVGWTLEALEEVEEVLGPGKEQSWGTNLSTLQQEGLAVGFPGPRGRRGWGCACIMREVG